MNKGTDFVNVTLASEDTETGDPNICFNLTTRVFLRATSSQASKFWFTANLERKTRFDSQGMSKWFLNKTKMG